MHDAERAVVMHQHSTTATADGVGPITPASAAMGMTDLQIDDDAYRVLLCRA
jgi:hypothetical protein